MVGAAAQGARARRLDGITFVQADAGALPFADGAFDLVTNAFGLMFASDPLRVLSEAHRVLVPGGDVALATWDDPSKSPLLHDHPRSVCKTSRAGHARHADRVTGPRIADADGWFSEVSVDSLSMAFEFESVVDYIQTFTDLAWKSQLRGLSPGEVERFAEAVAAAVRPFSDGTRVRLVAASLHAFGRK
jgi:ubiquinone/menaquinone biosynthesis C-methylase UbiE